MTGTGTLRAIIRFLLETPYSVRGFQATRPFTLSANTSFIPVLKNACFRMSITSSSVSTSGLIRKLSSISPLVQNRCVRSFRISCFFWCSSIFSSCYARRSLALPLSNSRLCFSSISFITGALLVWGTACKYSSVRPHPGEPTGSARRPLILSNSADHS